jgi:hypothetical protein
MWIDQTLPSIPSLGGEAFYLTSGHEQGVFLSRERKQRRGFFSAKLKEVN